MKDIEKELKRAQDKSIEFYARSTSQGKAEPVQAAAAADPEKKANEAEEAETHNNEDNFVMVEATTKGQQHEDKKTGKSTISKDTRRQTPQTGPPIQKPLVTKIRRKTHGEADSDKSSTTRSVQCESEEEDTEMAAGPKAITQAEMQHMLQPMQDPGLLQQPSYVGVLTSILGKLNMNHKEYETASTEKNQSFFSGVVLHQSGEDDSPFPAVGQTEAEK